MVDYNHNLTSQIALNHSPQTYHMKENRYQCSLSDFIAGVLWYKALVCNQQCYAIAKRQHIPHPISDIQPQPYLKGNSILAQVNKYLTVTYTLCSQGHGRIHRIHSSNKLF